jgi:hypothetical protein
VKCDHCGHVEGAESLHIGKSSMGWCFSLHVIPELGINSLADWQERWKTGVIENEYGETLTPEEMLSWITERRGHEWSDRDWQGFYGSEAQFHAWNQSLRGPRGLLRHRLGPHCIGHGEGTWDLIPGVFS